MYFVCETCNAKFFFSERNLLQCPRCGSLVASNEVIAPPWNKRASQPLKQESAPGRGGRQPVLHGPEGAYTTSPEGKATFIMTEIDLLRSINEQLSCILLLLTRNPLSEALEKSMYTCEEVSNLSQVYGAKRYKPFTVRLACSEGRVPEATKREKGAWFIPRDAVRRILEEGLPPERRNGRE